MRLHRGDVVLIVQQGDYGKPRPAVIVQIDVLNDIYDSVIVCLMTSTLEKSGFLRIKIEPTQENGLDKTSQIMSEKIAAVSQRNIRARIGCLKPAEMTKLTHAMALIIGLDE